MRRFFAAERLAVVSQQRTPNPSAAAMKAR